MTTGDERARHIQQTLTTSTTHLHTDAIMHAYAILCARQRQWRTQAWVLFPVGAHGVEQHRAIAAFARIYPVLTPLARI